MNLKLREGQSIVEHLNYFERIIAQLLIVGLSLDDETRACLLLNSLPDNWNTLVVSLGNSTPEGKVTLAIVRNSLFNEEIRRMAFWAMIHIPLSQRTGVEAKTNDHLGITIQEADLSLEGK